MPLLNRVRKISTDILEKYGDDFGQNFEDNKKALSSIAVITSKELKNEIAGFITKTVKREIRQERKREAELKALEEEEAELTRNEGVDMEGATQDQTTDEADTDDSDSDDTEEEHQ